MSNFVDPTIPRDLANRIYTAFGPKTAEIIHEHVDLRGLSTYDAMITLAQFIPGTTDIDKRKAALALITSQPQTPNKSRQRG